MELQHLVFSSIFPRGLERFFDVGTADNKALQKHIRGTAGETDGWVPWVVAAEIFGVLLAAILNQHLDQLTPVEIARVLFFHGEEPGLKFSEGKFCELTKDDLKRVAHEDEDDDQKDDEDDDTDYVDPESIKEFEKVHYPFVQIDTEGNSEVCRFIRRLLDKWSQQTPTTHSINEYQLEATDSDYGEMGYDADGGIPVEDEVVTDEADAGSVDERDHTRLSTTDKHADHQKIGEETVPPAVSAV
ncbi:hypothetical protein H2200_010035 [Cladophialophora chaetospira]|uniref:Uncharacterized protein n=1 Tax=Cladophialophora chaetospira TaxID=386627 RepID=A0AA39CEI9_9EURO|nr:hypothetical protein H2200_010035 [Cladophialophora chaetospira]